MKIKNLLIKILPLSLMLTSLLSISVIDNQKVLNNSINQSSNLKIQDFDINQDFVSDLSKFNLSNAIGKSTDLYSNFENLSYSMELKAKMKVEETKVYSIFSGPYGTNKWYAKPWTYNFDNVFLKGTFKYNNLITNNYYENPIEFPSFSNIVGVQENNQVQFKIVFGYVSGAYPFQRSDIVSINYNDYGIPTSLKIRFSNPTLPTWDGYSYNGAWNQNGGGKSETWYKSNGQLYTGDYVATLNGTPSFTINNKYFSFKDLFKIDLNETNKYSNDGKAFTKAPSIRIRFNEKLVYPIKQLYELYKLYNHIQNLKNQTNSNDQKFIKYQTILDNIKNLSVTYFEAKESLDAIDNISPIKLTKRNKVFSEFESNGGIIPKFEQWANQYELIMIYLKNNKISINYSLADNPSQIKTIDAWDGGKFNDIIATNIENKNVNYIKLHDVKFINNHFKDETTNDLNLNSLYQNSSASNFENISLDNNSIQYDFLFNENALNIDNYEQKQENVGNNAIDLFFNQYLSQIVNDNNEIIDDKIVLNYLNKAIFKSDLNQNLFTNIVSLNDSNIVNNLQYFHEGLKKFNLLDCYVNNQFTFKPNNTDGIFFTLLELDKWLYENETDIDIVHGNFTNEFIDNINANKDLYYVGSNENKGYVLARIKTNETIPLHSKYDLNKEFDYEYNLISNDPKNPLNVFNTFDNNYFEYIWNELNSKENWIGYQTETIKDNKKIISKNYKLNQNKKITYSFDNFNFKYPLFINNSNNLLDDSSIENYDEYLNVIREVIWNSSINFSNTETNQGKIVNRKLNNKKFDYYLNNKYTDWFDVVENKLDDSNLLVINYHLSNNNSSLNSFTYEISIEELLSAYSVFENSKIYQSDYSNKTNDIRKSIDTYVLKNETIKEENLNNGVDTQTLAIVLSVLVIVILISAICFYAIKKKNIFQNKSKVE